MDYSVGKIGRVFAARFQDGEAVYPGIEELARREGVSSAIVLAVGGARRGAVVVGPKDPHGAIDPIVRRFDDAREMLAFGTIFPADGKPALHMHGAIGRGDETIVGCPRQGLDAFLVLEVFIIEVEGLDAQRALDPESGLRLLKFLKPGTI
jgi:predicted DNA-binding protein with PD1-like motif